jgi:hypothetical protein
LLVLVVKNLNHFAFSLRFSNIMTGRGKEPGAGKSKKQAAAKPPPDLEVLTQSSTSPLEEISDLLGGREISDLLRLLPVHECVELTRRLLTSLPSLPPGADRARALLQIVVLFLAEYDSSAEEDGAN